MDVGTAVGRLAVRRRVVVLLAKDAPRELELHVRYAHHASLTGGAYHA